MSTPELLRKYDGMMNFVIKEYFLAFKQNVLGKKIIVFPCKIKNCHWAATFVFNPGGIEASNAHCSQATQFP
jgi:hypothetical protein